MDFSNKHDNHNNLVYCVKSINHYFEKIIFFSIRI